MIALGCDHGGYELKQKILRYLEEINIQYKDYGALSFDKEDDFPDFAEKVCKSIQAKECDKGILICGTGIGVSIAANKFDGIRAALCTDSFCARMSRMHNDANVLALGARVVGEGLALDIVNVWLNTDFLNGKYRKRNNKLEMIEQGKSLC